MPSIRIEFRKVFVFPDDVEMLTCAQDGQRFALLTQEIFYLFKSKLLNLHHNSIVRLCSLYVCIHYNNCFQLMKRD